MSHQMYSNAAGGPLPAIPRRPTNSRSTSTIPHSMKRTAKSPYRLQRSSSCSDSDGHSGPGNLRARRARGPHPPSFPQSLSTASLSSPSEVPDLGSLRASKTEDNIAHPKVYAPGMLRLSHASTSSPDIPKVACNRAPEHPVFIRKKSGQLVKPSLKTSRSANSDTFSALAGSSKSEPTTPVCKAVHFDAQLEHVKLFLAEQKPLAVSRDGSPTDDTSGTDSDFPSFIFGDSNGRRRGKLLVDVVNMPPRVNTYADVILEKLWISPDNTSILGFVRVRNIAFAKVVAVRFTFDSWQTTSEVTARYQESISSEFDRFTFAIKLTDLLARIEEKTLILAVKYTVDGRELWDNNHTLNYVGKFTRSIKDRSLSDEEGDSRSGNLESLQNKLEKVKDTNERTGPAFVAQAAVAVGAEPDGPTFKSTASFASRYDFSASLKNPFKYQQIPPTHQRNNSFPQLGNPSSSGATSPRATSPVKFVASLGSPRSLLEGHVSASSTSSSDDTEHLVTPRPEPQPRNHRRGYFDLGSFNAMTVKMTPPTSPPSIRALDDDVPGLDAVILGEPLLTKPVPTIPSSQPPSFGLGVDVSMASLGLFMGGDEFDSELSTPSLATPSSSRETTPSPTERFTDLPLGSDGALLRNPDPQYRDLINQFCFFTGPDSLPTDKSKYDFAGSAKFNALQHADSERTPETTPTLAPRARLAAGFSPQRPSSADDITFMKSASVTPTASTIDFHVLSDSESRSATPVAIPASA